MDFARVFGIFICIFSQKFFHIFSSAGGIPPKQRQQSSAVKLRQREKVEKSKRKIYFRQPVKACDIGYCGKDKVHQTSRREYQRF